MHWLSFPIERNIFEPHAASPGMIHGVIIKLLRMHDVTQKWSIGQIFKNLFILFPGGSNNHITMRSKNAGYQAQ